MFGRHLEKRYAKELENGSLKLIDVRKVDGMQMHELSYAEILDWPRGQQYGFMGSLTGCVERAPGEQATREGQITFTKSGKGCNVR